MVALYCKKNLSNNGLIKKIFQSKIGKVLRNTFIVRRVGESAGTGDTLLLYFLGG